jgi:hypothetical protein
LEGEWRFKFGSKYNPEEHTRKNKIEWISNGYNMLELQPMHTRLIKRTDLDMATPGRQSPLSGLLKQIKALKKNEVLIIETGQALQRAVAQRVRNNIFKWKFRYGLKHVSVHITKDGNVALYYDSK